MEKLSIVLAVIGFAVFVFTLWNHLLIKKYLRRFRGDYIHSNPLADEKYFDLKSRQEYIVSISAVVFALFTFLGYTSLTEIKKDMETRFISEQKKLDSLNEEAINKYLGLELRGNSYKDSVVNALKLVSKLKDKIKSILNKDVIKQDIYIVDPLVMGSLPKDKDDFRTVSFKDLETISGEKLPLFTTPPSIVCFSTTYSWLLVTDVTAKSFKIRPDYFTSATDLEKNGDHVKFSIWISQKSKDFSSDFSNDFR